MIYSLARFLLIVTVALAAPVDERLDRLERLASVAEKIAELDNVKQDKLRGKNKACTVKKAKDRWARVDLIVGILAHHLEDDE